MPKGRSQILFGAKCKDCGKEITPLNCLFKSHYLQPRCKPCDNKLKNLNPNRTKEARATSYRIWKFGIGSEEYNQKLALQFNGCAICKQPCSVRENLGIDHNHITGKNRDLLCHKCNAALGLVNEDEDILINMIEYLKRHNQKIA